jgi:hypothetical protein
MPYQDVKILDFKDMEIKGQLSIPKVYNYIVENPKPLLASSWTRPKGLNCLSHGFFT